MKNNNQTGRVSIVGRPNVGKSSLFNRILRTRHAVVLKKEGTTRDSVEKSVMINGKNIIFIDTGGFLTGEKNELYALVKKQIERAVESSELLLFVCDGGEGLMPLDIDLAMVLRKMDKKILLVINKIDNEERRNNLADFYKLGLGDPRMASCEHKIGIEAIIDEVSALVGSSTEDDAKADPIKVACVGRPNVGKSSFLNKVIDEERLIVHEAPHTTRDSVDVYFEKDGLSFLLIDTAGMRHKRKIKFAVETYSIMRSEESVRRSDIAFLVIDGMEGVTSDDARIFDFIVNAGKGCVIVVNKWDLVKGIETSRYCNAIYKKMARARHFPVVFLSAKTGRNVKEAFNLISSIKTNSELSIDSEALKDFIENMDSRNALPICSMRQTRLFPKEFTVYVRNPALIKNEHRAFLENRLRESFPLSGMSVKIFFKKRKRGKTSW